MVIPVSSAGAQQELRAYTDEGCLTRYRFCDNCDTPLRIRVLQNSSCGMPYWSKNGVIEHTLVWPPAHGSYLKSEPVAPGRQTGGEMKGVYIPQQDYVGPDYYEVRLDYWWDRNTRAFTTLKVSVDVMKR
jgi:hypothetical protein